MATVIRHWPDPPDVPVPSKPPGPFEQGFNFAVSMVHWLAEGAPVVDEPTLNARLSECAKCPSWDASERRCLACGCYTLKHHMATEKCPLGRWPAA